MSDKEHDMNDELETIARDEFMRSAFGGLKFPPIVKPEETAEQTMAKLDASAGLVMDPLCDKCGARADEVLQLDGDRPTAVGWSHRPGCPDGVEDEGAVL